MNNEFKDYARKVGIKAVVAFMTKMNFTERQAKEYFEKNSKLKVVLEMLTYEEIFWLVGCQAISEFLPQKTDPDDKKFWITKRERDGFHFLFVAGVNVELIDVDAEKPNPKLNQDPEIAWLFLTSQIHQNIEDMANVFGNSVLKKQAKKKKDLLLAYLKAPMGY